MTVTSRRPEAFSLLDIADASVSTPLTTQSGTLHLECVTIAGESTNRDVYLVLRINTFETPIDPARVIHISYSGSGQRIYTFDGNEVDPSDLVLTLPSAKPETALADDLETFEGILAQYADLRRPDTATSSGSPGAANAANASTLSPGANDLRGRLVLINEDNGEMVGEVDGPLNIREDPRLHEPGREGDPVIIEVPEGEHLGAREMFARFVPPEEQDWVTKSAAMIRYVPYISL
jgi:spartin